MPAEMRTLQSSSRRRGVPLDLQRHWLWHRSASFPRTSACHGTWQPCRPVPSERTFAFTSQLAKTSSAWAWGMPWGASAGQSGAQPHQHRRRRARRHSRGTSGVAPTGGLALTSGAQWRACLQVSVAKAKRCACSIRLACRDEQWCILSLLLAKFIALTTNFSYIGVGVLENLCLMLNTHVRTHTAVFSSRHCTSCRRLPTLPFSAAVPPSSKPEAEFCERWVE